MKEAVVSRLFKSCQAAYPSSYLLACIAHEQRSASFILELKWNHCDSWCLVAGLYTKQQPFYTVPVQSAITGQRQDTLALEHHCVTLKITAAGKGRLSCPECGGANYLSNHRHTGSHLPEVSFMCPHYSFRGDKMQGSFRAVLAFLLKVKALSVSWCVSTLVSFHYSCHCPKCTKSAGEKRIFLAA